MDINFFPLRLMDKRIFNLLIKFDEMIKANPESKCISVFSDDYEHIVKNIPKKDKELTYKGYKLIPI